MKLPRQFALNLRSRRERAGLNRRQFASRWAALRARKGSGSQAISSLVRILARYELDERAPRLEVAAELAEVLGVSVAALVEGDPPGSRAP